MRSYLRPAAIFVILVIAIVLPLLMIILGNDPENPPTLQDFGLNIFAESWGIFITVAIIDRLIKESEERRWLPSRNHVYARVYELICEYIFEVMPPASRRASNRVLVFSDFSGIPTYKTPLPSQQDYEEKLPEVIRDYRVRVNEIMDLSGFLMEPELLTMIQKLKYSLDRVAALGNAENEESRTSYRAAATSIAVSAWSIIKFLEKKASRITSIEQLVREMETQVVEMTKSPRET